MRPFAAAIALTGLVSLLPSALPAAPPAAETAPHPQLAQIHKVYLLSMGGGLDQYLANQLTAKGAVEVVTDAKLADAIFTDAIGTDFEARLDALLPPPPPVVVAPVAETKAETKDAKKSKDNKPAEIPYNTTSVSQRSSSFSHGRGNVFLVDLKSRAVVWSTHSVPKARTPADYDRTAARMVEAFTHDLGRK